MKQFQKVHVVSLELLGRGQSIQPHQLFDSSHLAIAVHAGDR